MSEPFSQPRDWNIWKPEASWSIQELKVPVEDLRFSLEPNIRECKYHALSFSMISDDEVLVFGGELQGERLQDELENGFEDGDEDYYEPLQPWDLGASDLYLISLRDFTLSFIETTGFPPLSRWGHASAAYMSYLIVWGGRCGNGPCNTDLCILDWETREWYVAQTPPSPRPNGRWFHTMTVCGDKLLVHGGTPGDGIGYCGDTWELDLNPLRQPHFEPGYWTPDWTRWGYQAADGPTPRIYHVCAPYDGKLYMHGGFDGELSNILDPAWGKVWMGDPSTQSWQLLDTTGIGPINVLARGAPVVRDSMFIEGAEGVFMFKFSELKWYIIDSPRLGCFSTALASKSKLYFLDLNTVYIVDTNSITFSWTNIRLTDGDALIQRVELLAQTPADVSGGFGDVFAGKYLPLQLKLALKRPRGIEATLKRFREEAALWSTFNHPNILPFLGALEIDKQLHLVSPWIEFGDLLSFVKRRSQYFQRHGLVSAPEPDERIYHVYRGFSELKTIREIADGIDYLHSIGIVHGDIKGPNVLISNTGGPLICDFGLAKLSTNITSTDQKGKGSVRWQSPELFDDHPKTPQSDIYAFSMVMAEVLTGELPYPHITSTLAVMMAVFVRGVRPKSEPLEQMGVDFRPLWRLAEMCWRTAPEDRPSIKAIIQRLDQIDTRKWSEMDPSGLQGQPRLDPSTHLPSKRSLIWRHRTGLGTRLLELESTTLILSASRVSRSKTPEAVAIPTLGGGISTVD